MSYQIALIGNPNCGKTTMFNRLTGSSQRVGNWPGVTIDKKEGTIIGTDCTLIDLPGIYSLSPYSPEEVVSRDFIVEQRPDAVLNIVDATNLERNLYLTIQVLDSNIPTVIALNMMDEVWKKGREVDVDILSKSLGCPVVPVSALKGDGIDELIETLLNTLESRIITSPMKLGEGMIEEYISETENAIKGKVPDESLRWHAIKLLEKDSGVQKDHPDAKDHAEAISDRMEKAFDDDADAVIASARYDIIERIVAKSVRKSPDESRSKTDKVDDIVMNKYLALPIFIGIIALIYFFSVSTIGSWGNEILSSLFEEISKNVKTWCIENNVSPILYGLLCNGIIKGVGAVLAFLPQMIVLFMLMCILEDIGYMSRIAFMMDRVFRYFGLSGKSLIPMLVGTGCGVPGIMASKTIESDRDRRITAMTVTFMPCGAKLPVIALISAALFNNNWMIGVFSYFLGIICALVSGIILKKWKSLAGKAAPFIMELPPYHTPAWYNIGRTTADRSWSFIKNAGTIILFACVFVWFLSSFDTSFHFIDETVAPKGSILQALGEAVCVLFAPIGWGNWELAVSWITGLIAKENIIGTIQILIGEGGIASLVTAAGGLSFLVFNLICAPCIAAVATMRKELGSWKITLAAIAYQTLFAYAIALMVYVAVACSTGVGVGPVSIALLILNVVILIYLIASDDPLRQNKKGESA